jgi:hypothetical protein
MTGRHFIFLVLLIAGAKILASYYGAGAEWLVIAAIALVAAYVSFRNERVLHWLATRIANQPNPEQALANLEANPIRADIAARVAIEPPGVPLRGSSEHFRYPASSVTVMRLMGVLSLGMLGLVTYLMIVDPSQREGKWYDILALFLVFGGGGGFFVYSGWFAPSIYEITDSHVALLGWKGIHRLIPWVQVSACSFSNSGVRIAGGGTVIRASFYLTDYGRFLNLVLSRVPPESRS